MEITELRDHIIVCGVDDSFVGFIDQLRRCDPRRTPIVILAPIRPSKAMITLKSLGPIFYVQVWFEALLNLFLFEFDNNRLAWCCPSRLLGQCWEEVLSKGAEEIMLVVRHTLYGLHEELSWTL